MGLVHGELHPEKIPAAGDVAAKPTVDPVVSRAITRVAERWLQRQGELLRGVSFAAVVDCAGLTKGSGIQTSSILASVGESKVPLILMGSAKAGHHTSSKKGTYWQVPFRCAENWYCVVMHMPALNSSETAAADRLLRWGVLTLCDSLSDALSYVQPNAKNSLPPFRLMLAQKTLDEAAARWVDDLQFRTTAVRISVGWVDGGRSRLLAVSGVPGVDVRRAFPRTLVAVCDECVKAAKPVVFPGPVSTEFDLVNHAKLFEHYGENKILTLPLISEKNVIGAVVFEFPASINAADVSVDLINELDTVLPVLTTLSERKPGLRLYVKRAVKKISNVLIRPATKLQQTVGVLTLTALLLGLFFPFPHNVSVKGEIQGADRQVLSAMHAGYLSSTSARAGDKVTAGQVLAQFDHTNMQLERDTWVSELARVDAALVQAMSVRDKAAIGRLRAEQSSAQAELELIDHRLKQSDIVAPFDGILVSGDLDDRLGSSVDAGESLFQIASLTDYSLRLDVPERFVGDVTHGARGAMRFAAFPADTFDFFVDSMVPVAIPEEGANVFRMRANMDGDTTQVRPGMSGVAKIRIGQTPWAVRASRYINERFRFWWWALGA